MTFRETQRRPAGRRRGRGLALGVALTALGVGALWWQRAPLATQLIDRELARRGVPARSEEHTSELQSLMRISYAVFCLKKQKKDKTSHSMSIDIQCRNTKL